MTKKKTVRAWNAQSDSIPDNMEVISVDLDINGSSQHIEVRAFVIPDGYNGPSSLEFSADLPISADPDLQKAAKHLSDTVIKRLRNPNGLKRKLACDSCVGSCCIKYPEVIVFEADVAGLCKATGLKSLDALRKAGIVTGNAAFGSIGYLARTPLPKTSKAPGGTACVFLSWDKKGVSRCGIYNQRPYTCRGFVERDCEDREDPIPRLYKIRPFMSRQPKDTAAKKRTNMDTYFSTRELR